MEESTKPERLDKLVSEAAGVPRTTAKEYIAKGQVAVNGVLCKKPKEKFIAPAITLKGEELLHRRYVYIMLNKPVGVVSATEDGAGPTVVDLVREDYPRRKLFPAGRLDKASEGFVLLTDDGAFAHYILAPKNHLPKTYIVELDIPFTAAMAAGFAAGLTLADGTKTMPATATVAQNPFIAEVVLHEGKYHQIKRMFGVLGAGVNSLTRTKIGPIALDTALPPGGHRLFTQEEIAALKAAAGHK